MRPPPNEVPRKPRERRPSAHPLGNGHALARSGIAPSTTREEFKPGGIGKDAKIGFEGAGDRDWRRDFQALHDLEVVDVARLKASVAIALGAVFFHDQLKAARATVLPANDSPLDKAINQGRNAAGGMEAESLADFAVRWRNAILAEMGPEEYDKFLLACSEAHHCRTTRQCAGEDE